MSETHPVTLCVHLEPRHVQMIRQLADLYGWQNLDLDMPIAESVLRLSLESQARHMIPNFVEQ